MADYSATMALSETQEQRRRTLAKTFAGIFLGLLIGSACRWFDIPLPSPPKLLGALLVVAMTVGYMATGKLLSARSTANTAIADGPTGQHLVR